MTGSMGRKDKWSRVKGRSRDEFQEMQDIYPTLDKYLVLAGVELGVSGHLHTHVLLQRQITDCKYVTGGLY